MISLSIHRIIKFETLVKKNFNILGMSSLATTLIGSDE